MVPYYLDKPKLHPVGLRWCTLFEDSCIFFGGNSISSSTTKVYNGKIKTIVPTDNLTEFTINAKVGDQIQGLCLKSVKSQQSECTVS